VPAFADRDLRDWSALLDRLRPVVGTAATRAVHVAHLAARGRDVPRRPRA